MSEISLSYDWNAYGEVKCLCDRYQGSRTIAVAALWRTRQYLERGQYPFQRYSSTILGTFLWLLHHESVNHWPTRSWHHFGHCFNLFRKQLKYYTYSQMRLITSDRTLPVYYSPWRRADALTIQTSALETFSGGRIILFCLASLKHKGCRENSRKFC